MDVFITPTLLSSPLPNYTFDEPDHKAMNQPNKYPLQTSRWLMIAALCAGPATHMPAALITVTNQINNYAETTAANSAFYTQSPDNAINLADLSYGGGIAGMTGSLGGGGRIGAGDGASLTSTGTLTILGNSTSSGGWVDGNKIPAGITLTFDVTFSISTPAGFLTTQGNSGTQLGNGIGVTDTAGSTGQLVPGTVVEISQITINNVSWSGTLAEAGFSITPGGVGNARYNRLRSNNFTEASAGATVTVGGDSWGFGTSVGGQGGNLVINNNYTDTVGFVTAGPMVISTELGAWNLKGIGFEIEATYEITGEAITPTWAGGGGDDNWSTGANWDGGLAPTNGQPVRFGAALRQNNFNDLTDLTVAGMAFTNSGFTLNGNTLTNTAYLTNQTGTTTLNLNYVVGGTGSKRWHFLNNSKIILQGEVFNPSASSSLLLSGLGELIVTNSGAIVWGSNVVNQNIAVGQLAESTNILTVANGGVITISNAASGVNANRIRLGVVEASMGTLNINNGGVIALPDSPINDGRGQLTIGFGSNSTAIVNLNPGGRLLVQRIDGTDVNSDSTFNFNGGLLQAHRINAATFFPNMDRVQIRNGGAVVEITNTITFATALTEDPSSPGGGLVKLGGGNLTLTNGNTYTGPTIVSNGTLTVWLPSSSGAMTLRPDAQLSIAVNNSSLTVPAVTLDGNTNRLTFAFGDSGATTTPLFTTTLTKSGVTVINVTGTFTTTGSYPLIDYSTLSGSGSFQLGTRPLGTIASLVTNIANSSIDLLVSDIASDLLWSGAVNATWDIATTANWEFLSGGSGATTYNENVNSGDYVTFFNGFPNTAITLATSVKPLQMNFLNSSTPYSIAGGAGVGINGPGRMLVQGGGTVTLTTSNSFSGGVSNNLGFVEIGNDSALGTGPVTLWPVVTGLKNTGLRSDGSTARTLSNAIQFRSFAGNELNFQLGDTTANGKITFTGPVNLNARRNEISMDSDVEFSGTLTNGHIGKTGPGQLIFKGTSRFSNGDIVINQGDVVVAGGAWTNANEGLRLNAADGLSARVIVTNNGIVTLEGGSSLRVAGATVGSFAQGSGTNEFILYSGELNCVGNTGLATIGNPASLSQLGRIALLGGTVTARGIQGLANTGDTELVLNGATIRASLTGAGNLNNFIAGFTNAVIQAGGVVIETEAGRIANVTQALQGSGGLTKTGAGILRLDGVNSYTGATIVNGGALGGTGVIAGAVTVNAAGTLAPGNADIGTLTINNTLNLQGGALLKVNSSTLTSDQVSSLTDVAYGGGLVVTNLSGTPFVGGEVFQIFAASGSKSGNFSSVTILPETGATGSFNPATGELTISVTVAPVFDPISVVGGNLIWTGSGFPANGSYSILTSTNVAAPLAAWTTNSTGIFSGSGGFSNAIPLGLDPHRFFLLKTP
jgi:autotransporter-associated beta strand protein